MVAEGVRCRRMHKKVPAEALEAWLQQCKPTRTEYQNSSTVQVSAGGEHTFVLTDAGELWAWGEGNHGQLAAAGVHMEREQGDETVVRIPSLGTFPQLHTRQLHTRQLHNPSVAQPSLAPLIC